MKTFASKDIWKWMDTNAFTDPEKALRWKAFQEALSIDKVRSELIKKGIFAPPVRNAGEPIRVAFVLYSIAQREHLCPIYDRMFVDKRFCPFLVAFSGHAQTESTFSFFKKLYPKSEGHHVIGAEERSDAPIIFEYEPDVVFLQRPYVNDFPYDYHPFILSLYSRIAYTSYGILLNLGAKETATWSNVTTKNAWRIYAESNIHADHYKSISQKESVVITGSPKVDLLRSVFSPKKENTSIEILWSCHLGSTSFIDYFESMNRLATFSGVHLTVRPHPFLRHWFHRNKILNNNEFDRMINKLMKLGATYSQAGAGESYIHVLMTTDIFISDFSTLILEYGITSRPVIFLSDPTQDSLWLGQFGRDYIDNCTYPVKSEIALDRIIDELVIQKSDVKADNRITYIKKLNLFPKFSVAVSICDDIDKALSGRGEVAPENKTSV